VTLFESMAASSRKALDHKNGPRPAEQNHYYKTPPAATEALLRVEQFTGLIHEPACGDGAISEVLKGHCYEVVSSDLIDRGYGTPAQDFLLEQNRTGLTMITNPPFKLADEFALHALHLGYRHIALFGRLAWLEGNARHKRLWEPHPPSRIWVFKGRQTLWRGDEANPGKGGAVAFCWVVWQQGHTGTQLGWI
jgi:hypothetical protein